MKVNWAWGKILEFSINLLNNLYYYVIFNEFVICFFCGGP